MPHKKPASPVPVVQPRNLNVTQAAQYLGATPWFVRSLAWERAIPYTRLGKRLLFDRIDLDQFLESQKVMPESHA
jgi:excisionase family DNA binding protein